MRRSIAAISFGALGLAFSAVAAASDKGGLSLGDEPVVTPQVAPLPVDPLPCPVEPAPPALLAPLDPVKMVPLNESPVVPAPPAAPRTQPKTAPKAAKRNVLKVIATITFTGMKDGKKVTTVIIVAEASDQGHEALTFTGSATPLKSTIEFTAPTGGPFTWAPSRGTVYAPFRFDGMPSYRGWQGFDAEKKCAAERASAPKRDTASVVNAAAKGATFLGGFGS